MTIPVLKNSEMRGIEKGAIQDGISESELISNAGARVYNTAQNYVEKHKLKGTWTFLCGKGHNGADGLKAALVANEKGYSVEVFHLFADKYSPESTELKETIQQKEIPYVVLKDASQLVTPSNRTIIIDGLLGTGVTREPKGLVVQCIQWMNGSKIPVISIDIPSGLSPDVLVLHAHVKATETISLGAAKISSLFAPTCHSFGTLRYHSLQFPREPLKTQPSSTHWFTPQDARESCPTRKDTYHKYSSGKVLIIAGSKGMHGAAIMAAQGAIKSGAGLVRLLVPEGIFTEVASQLTESVMTPLKSDNPNYLTPLSLEQAQEHLEWADAILLGPGTGPAPETTQFFTQLLAKIPNKTPVILDGNALEACNRLPENHGTIIVTPHEGEYTRLGGNLPQGDDLWNRVQEGQSWVAQKGLILLQKGSTTVYHEKNTSLILPKGPSALATAGTGDILAGILASMLCHKSPSEAAGLAVYLHSYSAWETIKETGVLGLHATRLLDFLPKILSQLQGKPPVPQVQ